MDIQRKNAGKKRLVRRIIYVGIVLAAIPLITMGLNRLKPAAPTVERATLWPDTVKRGTMDRQVRGIGTLVPEETLLIPASTDGRVDKRLILAGTKVKRDTVLMELTNPELQTAMIGAEYNLKSAEAGMKDLKAKLESERLDKKAIAAQVQSDYHTARLTADRDKELLKEGLIPDLQEKLSTVKAEELATRDALEKERLDVVKQSVQAQLDAQQVKVDQLRAEYQLKKDQVEALKVRAGTEGIMQQLLVEVGQRVTAGTPLAKVTQPWKLKAALQIAETQAKDIVIGQDAEVDTRNGIIPAKVMRIDPSVISGTRTVDLKLEGSLPPGAVPDLSVDGTIELERLTNVMYVGRPVFGQPNSTVTLFKLEPDGKHASRVKVKLGRSSVNTIEILDGLKVGDTVILSDMSAMDQHDRILLN